VVRIVSTVNMVAIFFSETSVGFYRTTRPYIPEDRNLNIRLFENVK
jgi:hypothetical protein